MPFWSRSGPEDTSSALRRFDVIFVLPHMGRGGAQRVTSIVANAWARQGKKICILTWDGHEEIAHDLDPRIERIDMPSFTRELVFRAGIVRRTEVEIRYYMREAERWLRPRLPWRRLGRRARASASSIELVIRYFPDRRPWWSSRPIRRMAASAMVFLDRRRKESAFRTVSSIGRASFSRLVLGHRVDAFREAFLELDSLVIISLLTKTNLYVLEAVRGMKVRVVISERNDPDLQQIDPGLASLRWLAYRDAYAVTSNSAGILEKLSAFVPAEKLKLLPNPVEAPAVADADGPRGARFVSVARLVPQKGIDLLLSAFAKIAGEVADWNLEIVGDGPLRDVLMAQAKALGIGDRVTFHGFVPNPTKLLQSGRVFVLPSRFEGMPNALLEAMACGLAPIVTDASPGPLESVTHNETGLVVPSENISALAEAMRLLASDDGFADRLGRQASAYVTNHDWSVVEPQWLQVLGIDSGNRADELLAQATPQLLRGTLER